MQYYNQHGQPVEGPRRSQPWGQVIVSLATILIAVLGVKSDEFGWLVYFCIPLIVVSFLLLVWQSPCKEFLLSQLVYRKDKKILLSQLDNYQELVSESEIAEELFKAVSNLKWPSTLRPPTYRHPDGYSRSLVEASKLLKHRDASQLIHLNQGLKRNLEYIDGYLSHCDQFVINREVLFDFETEKVRLQKLIREYEGFINKHNAYCKQVNTKLSRAHLNIFFGKDLCFSPKDLASSNKVNAPRS